MDLNTVEGTEWNALEADIPGVEDQNQRKENENRNSLVPEFLKSPPLPYIFYPGKITYCSKADEIESAASACTVLGEIAGVGFDIEWTVTFEIGKPPRPVATIQLCVIDPRIPSSDGSSPYHCYILHLSACRKQGVENKYSQVSSLARLLSSTSVLKTGVGIRGDATKVKRDLGIDMNGIIDVRDMAKERIPQKEAEKDIGWSLGALTEKILKYRVRKYNSIRCSDWDLVPLTENHLKYAATDAYLSLHLYECLQKMPIPRPSPLVLSTRPPTSTNKTTNAVQSSTTMLMTTYLPCTAATTIPKTLQPAKALTLEMYRSGMDITTIAQLRNIQPSTVQSYLAEAMVAGYEYQWSSKLLGVADAEFLTISYFISTTFSLSLVNITNDTIVMPPTAATIDVLPMVLKKRGLRFSAVLEEMNEIAAGALPVTFSGIRLVCAHLGRCHHETFSSLDQFKIAD